MLFLSPGTSQLLRGQGTFLSDDEITRVTDFVATDSPQFARELIELKTKEELEAQQPTGDLKNRDELYEAAVDIVVRERRGSVSLLQRCLGIGYGRAARLIDYMAEDKIVGDYNGAQAREVLISIEDWEAMAAAKNAEEGGGGSTPASPSAPMTAATVPPKPRRVTKILPGSDEPSDLEDDGPARGGGGATRRAGSPLSASGAKMATATLAAPWENEQAETDDEGEEADAAEERELDEADEADEWSEVEDSELEEAADADEEEVDATDDQESEASEDDSAEEEESDADDDGEEEWEYEEDDAESKEDEDVWEEDKADEWDDEDDPPRSGGRRAESA